MLLSDRGRTMHPAQVIGFDEDFDIAVLKFDGEGLGLTPARLGDRGVRLSPGEILRRPVGLVGQLPAGPGRVPEGVPELEDFDIAVLKFDGEGLGLTPARLGDSDLLAVGDPVYAEAASSFRWPESGSQRGGYR